MSDAAVIAPDTLVELASADVQKTAARMAQDVFAGVFRLTLEGDSAKLGEALAEVQPRCDNWCRAGGSEDARALRLALLVSGLDQWGLAYSQAFGLQAIPALTVLLGNLRTSLDAASDARFQQYFQRLEQVEADAIDFKVELRRSIHLALWHAMAACDSKEEAHTILQCLGGLMVALVERMPGLGWRLLADALASIQLRLLASPDAASQLAQETTQQLFESLRRSLPRDTYQAALAHSGKAVIAWQRAQRPGA